MTSPGAGARRIARVLRQQGELGGGDLFLDRLTREEARVLAVSHRHRRPAETAARGGAGGLSPLPVPGYEALRSRALSCQACQLSRTRTQVVFSDGNPPGRLMVVGEAPGEREDATGRVFVGPAGKLLDLLLASVGLSRETSVYICNVLKCRPPGNRDPLPGEIEACTPLLRSQIELLAPEAILAVGLFSGQFLSGKEAPLGKLRGEVYSYLGVPLLVTYHPAALLRNPGLTRAAWEDLQLLRQLLDGVGDKDGSR